LEDKTTFIRSLVARLEWSSFLYFLQKNIKKAGTEGGYSCPKNKKICKKNRINN
jgi:hypothetical protein